MTEEKIFRRKLERCKRDKRIMIDSELENFEYVNSFGFEWTQIDGFIGKESMSHGHIFGRFLLPKFYFKNKTVIDVGCGNGRIGRIIGPLSAKYFGCDLSESVYAFPSYLEASNISLIRASGTNLPFYDEVSDISVCWGVLHHMDDPFAGLKELFRVTKSGGEILIFIYSKGYDGRKNLNEFAKHITDNEKHQLIESTSDYLDGWREVDPFFANQLSANLFMSVKHSREWQIFQWFDGITPQYHWSLEEDFEMHFREMDIDYKKTHLGCYRIKKK